MSGQAEPDLEPVFRGGLLLRGNAGACRSHVWRPGCGMVEPEELVEHVRGDAERRSALRAPRPLLTSPNRTVPLSTASSIASAA